MSSPVLCNASPTPNVPGSFLGGQGILDIWPSLSQSPILTQFTWSPLVTSAVERNFVALSDPHSSSDFSPSPSSPTDTYPALLAVHIRRGDYKRHCARLAKWGVHFHGFNAFEDLPDPWIPITGASTVRISVHTLPFHHLASYST